MSQTKEKIIPKTSRGRPKDPNLEERVFDAVMQLYSAGGWSKLSFEAVAKAAGTGKSALYSRWPNRAALLKAALEARWLPVDKIDNGSLKADLRELAELIFSSRTGKWSQLQTWFAIDSTQHPEVKEVTSPYIQETVLQGRSIVRRAVARKEVPDSFKPGLLMDLVVGAVVNHVNTTPDRLRENMITQAPEFLDELVEVVLKGVSD